MKKKKSDNKKFYKIGFYSILAVLILLIVIPTLFPQNNQYRTPANEDMAQLVPYTSDWFVNVENQDQIVFFVSLANYGFAESKNTNIACELYQTNDDGALLDNIPDYTVNKTLKSVNATSTTEVEVVGTGIEKLDQQIPYIGLCKVESCENCEILTERLSK